MSQNNSEEIKLSQTGGTESEGEKTKKKILRDAILRTVLGILDRCSLFKGTKNVDPFLEQFFYQHGYVRYPAFDGFQNTGSKVNAQFDDDLIEVFFNKAGYLRYGDKFIKYA